MPAAFASPPQLHACCLCLGCVLPPSTVPRPAPFRCSMEQTALPNTIQLSAATCQLLGIEAFIDVDVKGARLGLRV